MVDILNGQYNGQNLIKLVSIMTAATMPRTIATVPEMMFKKYKTPINNAIAILNFLSVVPMLFFIVFVCLFLICSAKVSVLI